MSITPQAWESRLQLQQRSCVRWQRRDRYSSRWLVPDRSEFQAETLWDQAGLIDCC